MKIICRPQGSVWELTIRRSTTFRTKGHFASIALLLHTHTQTLIKHVPCGSSYRRILSLVKYGSLSLSPSSSCIDFSFDVLLSLILIIFLLRSRRVPSTPGPSLINWQIVAFIPFAPCSINPIHLLVDQIDRLLSVLFVFEVLSPFVPKNTLYELNSRLLLIHRVSLFIIRPNPSPFLLSLSIY